MKNAVRLLVAFILLAALAVVFLRTTEVSPQPASPTPATSATPTPATANPAPAVSEKSPAPSETAAADNPTPRPEAPLQSGEAAVEAISDLSATYDAAAVPALARYLGHSDPEIRAAARDGLINLGERAAIPYLESAAKKADPIEAKELRAAAEFLALPTWTERRAAQRKAKAEAANSAP